MSVAGVAEERKEQQGEADVKPGKKRGKAVKLRRIVQAGFLAAVCVIGVRFGIFVHSIAAGEGPAAYRPPGVEGFLPISSLMSATYFVKAGVLNHVHPAGLVILALTVALAIAVRRGFCSWACPIGAVSEYAYLLGRRLSGRNFALPGFLDVPLRALKYMLLGMFLYVITTMSAESLDMFIHGPYNRIADVKMYLFFADISSTAAAIIAVLFILSMMVKNFWCRYLCPYGAMLGIVSYISPAAITRDEAKCIGCGACARACPNRIAVNKKRRVNSPECMACYGCADVCPKAGALEMKYAGRRALTAAAYALIIVMSFFLASRMAAAFGYWQTDTPAETYRVLYKQAGAIGHPRSMDYNAEELPGDPVSGHSR